VWHRHSCLCGFCSLRAMRGVTAADKITQPGVAVPLGPSARPDDRRRSNELQFGIRDQQCSAVAQRSSFCMI
jgi:hypothetical protein